MFVAAFLVSAQVAQEFLVTEWGWAVGGLAAGFLLLAIMPLQRFSGRVADAAMPGVADTPEYRTVRKREVYRSALEEALTDGSLSTKDRKVLATLADHLGLTNREVARIEADAEGQGRPV